MRMSLGFGARLDHEPVWLPPLEADAFLVALRDDLPWEQREIVLLGRRILLPRLIAWAGDVGYRYSGQTLEPRPFTPATRGLLARTSERTGVPFNHILADRYRSGDERMGLHADDEPELGEDPVVAIVSLCTSRRLVVRPRRKDVRQRPDLDLGHGSFLPSSRTGPVNSGGCPPNAERPS
jgi:alkylated DNA repair dioxygenase AlkB